MSQFVSLLGDTTKPGQGRHGYEGSKVERGIVDL